MTDQSHNDIEVGPPPEILRQRGSSRSLKIIVLLAIIGGSCGIIWVNRDRFSDLSKASPVEGAGSPGSTAAEGFVSAKDLASIQQQTASSIRVVNDAMAAQQAELKRLSDQMEDLSNRVAAMTSKIFLLQGGDAAAAPAAAPARPAAAAPRKKPAAVPKPAGAISVGGAPLPAAPDR